MLPETIEALELWRAVQTQWRVGMGPMGLDYNALIKIADLMEIDLTPRMMGKIRALERYFLDKRREKHAERDPAGRDQTAKRLKG